MRLRYLHISNYGVLTDLRVHFDRERIFREHEKLMRVGDLHFVVGLNGTGKSSLLRALYETFRWLEGVNRDLINSRTPFPFPVTLVYDLPLPNRKDGDRTCIFHHEGQSVSDGFFFAAMSPLNEADHGDWNGWIEWLKPYANPNTPEQMSGLVPSDKLQGNGQVRASLPDPLLVYTSGSLAVWDRVREPDLPDQDLNEIISVVSDDERPRGWDVHRELALPEDHVGQSERGELRKFTDPSTQTGESHCQLLKPIALKLAALAVSLTQASSEMPRLASNELEEVWRHELAEQIATQPPSDVVSEKTARSLLNYADWWYPTHLSMEYRPSPDKLNAETHAQQLVLCALAEEVIRQPLGRMQMVIYLGPRTITLSDKIAAVYGDRDIPIQVQEVVNRVEGSTSGAQAVVRTLCRLTPNKHGNLDPERARWEIFQTLHSWHNARLLDDVTVTIRRITKMEAIDGELDDVVVTWEDLSDGEQMLLGRMSLLLLLSGRHGSLLLLDEPETHFNDSWKREIIDIVDDNILRTTAAHVIVSTHTSIALTDAFASEIIRLIRSNGRAEFKPVSFASFGAEPGRVMLNVFNMPEAIGSRAEEVLRILLEETNWQGRRSLLEHVVAEVGGGWPRARLREILEEL
ncbi:AAA family ATPase [Blastopirellula sp. JC732]|uniref:AAA family ATPase n=1 Tax=Blastopirellula sediminis TaxID=2894196 RepID=A0A9X1SGR6_9BACT|nr:AAA family ATPase [Blastopirellula sediminis]MCC9606227.1 AAA family ATPase [Blastopirellula sediminis]MCC9630475.1 AAA family ATPase [Blastopirellula sediminis]